MKTPFSLYGLYLLHLLLAVSALAGGIMMLWRPDGALLGLDVSRLEHTVFSNYRAPGILLLLFNCVLPLFALLGMMTRPDWKAIGALNIYRNMQWGWTYSLYTGIVVIVWITGQLFLTSYFWLHPVVILLGLSILIFTLLPVHVRYFMHPRHRDVYLYQTSTEKTNEQECGSTGSPFQTCYGRNYSIGTGRENRYGQPYGGTSVRLWFRRTGGYGH